MKTDEARAGIKFFNGGDDNSDELAPNAATGTSTRFMRSIVVVNAKRSTLKSESRQKNFDEQCKELSVSLDGIKKSSIPERKSRTEAVPIQARKLRSNADESSSEGAERSLCKSKSDLIRTSNQNNAKSRVGENNSSIRLRKTKSASDPISDESSNGINDRIENVPAQNYEKDNDSDENCKDFEVCEEKLISSSTDNVSVPKCSAELSVPVIDGDAYGLVDDEEEDDEEVDDVDETIELETEESSHVKEINIPAEPKIVKESENNKVENEEEKNMVVKKPENNNNKVVNELDKKVIVKRKWS